MTIKTQSCLISAAPKAQNIVHGKDDLLMIIGAPVGAFSGQPDKAIEGQLPLERRKSGVAKVFGHYFLHEALWFVYMEGATVGKPGYDVCKS